MYQIYSQSVSWRSEAVHIELQAYLCAVDMSTATDPGETELGKRRFREYDDSDEGDDVASSLKRVRLNEGNGDKSADVRGESETAPGPHQPDDRLTVVAGGTDSREETVNGQDMAQNRPTAGDSAADPSRNGSIENAEVAESDDSDVEEAIPCAQCSLPSIYSCPRCAIRSCSVSCVQKHKTDTGCNGEVDKTKYVALKDMNVNTLYSDIGFLNQVAHARGASARVISNASVSASPAAQSNGAQGRVPRGLANLQRQRELQGAQLTLSPVGMLGRLSNQSYYSFPKKSAFWTLKLVFLSSLTAEQHASARWAWRERDRARSGVGAGKLGAGAGPAEGERQAGRAGEQGSAEPTIGVCSLAWGQIAPIPSAVIPGTFLVTRAPVSDRATWKDVLDAVLVRDADEHEISKRASEPRRRPQATERVQGAGHVVPAPADAAAAASQESEANRHAAPEGRAQVAEGDGGLSDHHDKSIVGTEAKAAASSMMRESDSSIDISPIYGNAVVRQTLRNYRDNFISIAAGEFSLPNIATSGIRVFIRLLSPANDPRFAEFKLTELIRDSLANVSMLDYPTVFFALPEESALFSRRLSKVNDACINFTRIGQVEIV